MRKLTFIAMGLFIGSAAFAQKATSPKQDSIIAMQQRQIKQMQVMLDNQNKLITMYGAGVPLNNALDSMSYGYGMAFGEGLMGQGINEINYNALTRGMNDFFNENFEVWTMPQAQQYINDYTMRQLSKRADEAKEKGAAFMAENGKREGVTTTESGLQYEVIKEGSGDKPQATNKVTVHYEGRLIDGTLFDSSKKRGEPITFPLNQVIAGWTEGVQQMSPGSVYKFWIPSNLAYGDQGAGMVIGPGETLVFEVELISFQ